MKRLELWAGLQQLGAVQGPAPADDGVPWPLRILLGLGAWLASLLTLGFLAFMLEDVIETQPGRLVIAALAAGAAYQLIDRSAQRPFLGQLGLVMACLMQLLLVFDVFDSRLDAAGCAFAIALIAVGSLVLPSRLWRVWCVWLALFAAGWLVRALEIPLGVGLLAGASGAAAAWLWLHPELLARRFELCWPLALGLSIGSLGLTSWNPAMWWVSWFFTQGGIHGPLMNAALATVLLAAVNCWIVFHAGRALGVRQPQLTAVVVVLIAAATFSTPAVSAALGLLLLGWSRSQWVLTALGIVGLLLGMSAHYYGLNWSLSLKALSMLSAGVGLLAARIWILRRAQELGVVGEQDNA